MTAISSNSIDLSTMNSMHNLKQKKVEQKEIEDITKVVTNVDQKEAINKNNIKIPKTNFSYDEKTKDMIIKIEKNGSTFQYPSEDLLRLKKFLMEESSGINS